MIKKLLLAVLGWLLVVASVSALELNSASQAELDALKGIGPVKSKAIVDERTKNGPFKNADDFATRVKGVGDKTVVNLEAQGLTINGSSAPPAGSTAKPAAPAKVPAANVKSTPAATPAPTPAPAAVPANAMKTAAPAAMAASSADTASDAASAAHGKKSKKASKKEKAAASAASAAAAASSSSKSK
jgi:competence protein ComEA